MTTYLDILKKHKIDIASDMTNDIWVSRNPSRILSLSKEQINALEYKTILKALGYDHNTAQKVLSYWTGTRDVEFYVACLDRSEICFNLDIKFDLANYIDNKMENPSEFILKLVKLVKEKNNTQYSTSLEYLFQAELKSDTYIEENILGFKHFSPEIFREVVSSDMTIDYITYFDNIPDNVYEIIINNIDAMKLEDISYLPYGFYNRLTPEIVSSIKDKAYIDALVTSIIKKAKSKDIFETMMKYEKCVSDMFGIAIKVGSASCAEYILHSSKGISKKDVDIELMLTLDHTDIKLFYSAYTTTVYKLIHTEKFIYNTKVEFMKIIHLFNIESLDINLVKFIISNLKTTINNVFSLNASLKLCLRDESFIDYLDVYSVLDLSREVNRNDSINSPTSILALDVLLTRDKKYIKHIDIEKLIEGE